MPFLGWSSDPFKGLSDLQLGDEKVTLNHLGWMCFLFGDVFTPWKINSWTLKMMALEDDFTFFNWVIFWVPCYIFRGVRILPW